MIINVYSKRGDMSSFWGLRVNKTQYDDDFFAKPSIYGTEIDEDEYYSILELFNDPNLKRGFDGVVNEEGYAKYLEKISAMENKDAV